ncbi:MAG TPA: DUF2563 family protein [Mycobacterium sp.]|jgi:hypothetical protein|nr:DUF2563 family protein [Mycobacterium sp.]
MFVDTGLLDSVANESHSAHRHADDTGKHLSRGPLRAGIFGDFAAAHSCREAVSAAHAHPAKTLKAATEFTDMDERGAAKPGSVRCSCAT